LNALSTR